MRRIIVASAVLALAFGLAACGSTRAPSNDTRPAANVDEGQGKSIDFAAMLDCPPFDGGPPRILNGVGEPAVGALAASPEDALKAAEGALPSPVDQYRMTGDEETRKVYTYQVKDDIISVALVDQVGDKGTWVVTATAVCAPEVSK